jgi:hypothetical protein
MAHPAENIPGDNFPQGLKSLRENLLEKMMGAPGLAFETWDPSRKCRKINLGSSDFETALGT